MKRILFLPVVLILFSACRKNLEQEIWSNEITSAGSRDAAAGNTAANIEPTPAYTWKAMTALADGHDGNSTLIQSGNDVYCVIQPGEPGNTYKYNSSTRLWELSAVQGLEDLARDIQYLFCHNGKVYFGMKNLGVSIDRNFMSRVLNPTSINVSLAPFPGVPVLDPTCFVVGDKGYIMGGRNTAGTPINQLWEYTFTSNQWVDKGGSPLGARAGAVAMVVGNKAYMGLGYDHTSFNGSIQRRYKKDWILYDPSSTFFTSKASFPGPGRAYAKGFLLNDVPFIGFGGSLGSAAGFTDFWKYSPSSNAWTEQQSWTGTVPSSARRMNCFSLGTTGYAILGCLLEFKKFSNTPF